jgi:hypothetical protein
VNTGGNNANTGNSFVQRQRDFLNVTTAAGDTVLLKASPDPFRVLGLNTTPANGSWQNLDDDVPISETHCKIVHECDAAPTAAANVTGATSAATFKGGTAGWQVTVAAGFATGMACYGATVTGDYSNCDRISFWLYQSSGTAIPASTLDVRLCSDTAGAVVVDTFTIPFILSVGSNQWNPIELTRNGGGNLGASIQSISIAFSSDPGAVVLFIDNIIATNATGITHQCLVGKSSDPENIQFYPVRIIAAANIKLDLDVTSNGATAKRGYSGTTETVAIYARKPLITYTVQVAGSNGSAGSRITWSGGWNSTDMSTQTGVTYLLKLPMDVAAVLFDNRTHFNAERILGIGGWLRAWGLSNSNNYTVTQCGAVGASVGIQLVQSTAAELVDCIAIGNSTGFQSLTSATSTTLATCEAYGNTTGFSLGVTWTNPSGVTGCTASNNVIGFTPPSICDRTPFTDCVARDNSTAFNSAGSGSNVDFYAPVTSGNNTVFGLTTGQTGWSVWEPSHSEAQSAWGGGNLGSRLRFHRVGDVQTDERERAREGWVLKVDDSGWAGTGHTPSGSVWRMQPTSDAIVGTPLICIFEPGVLPVGSHTVTLKSYRTNANVTGKLVVKGRRTDGIATDTASSNISAAINTSETLSLSFDVDTEGAVWLEVHAWFTTGSTGEVWFDEITIT